MDNHVEELIEFKERCKSNTKRIDKLEEDVKENKELTIAVKEIATEMKYLREEQSSIDERLKVIEEKPVKEYEETKSKIKDRILGFILGIILMFLALKLGLKDFV